MNGQSDRLHSPILGTAQSGLICDIFLNGDSAKRQCHFRWEPFGFRVRHFEVADAGVANSRFMTVPVSAYSSWTGVTR
jgi:hypothetical protein